MARHARIPSGGPVRVYPVAVATAAPDEVNERRERALRRIIGRGLQGHSGTVIGYDRGDPENSITAVMAPVHNPTAAMARIGMRDGLLLDQAVVQDQATNDPELSAYESAMFMRIAR